MSTACNNPEVKKESFTISGSLANKISAGDNLSLRISGEAENVATAVVTEEGTFTFNVNVEKEQFLTLYIEDRAVVEIITEGNDIAISMDEESNHINIEVTGNTFINNALVEGEGHVIELKSSYKTENTSLVFEGNTFKGAIAEMTEETVPCIWH